MKIHFYQNQAVEESRSLSGVIEEIKGLDLKERERLVNGKTVLLETIEESDNFFKMDFTQRRIHNGPGYSRPGSETEDFEIERGAGFGEQTALVYAPDKEYLAIQYNHFGLRSPAIAAYFGMFGGSRHADSFEFDSVVNEEIYAKLLRSEVQTRFQIRIASEKISESMYENNVPIETALRFRDTTAAGHVEINLSYGENKRGGRLNIINQVKSLMENPAVENMKVSVKERMDSATEILDLLEHREAKVFPDDQLFLTSGLRFSFESRITALTGEFKSWLQSR